MFNLSDFGIDLASVQENPQEAIVTVLKLYEESAKQYRDSGEKVTVGVKKVSESIKANDPGTVNLNDDLMATLREAIYKVLVIDPNVSVLLFDSLQELKDGVASFRQEAMRSVPVDDSEDDSAAIEDQSAKYEEVEFLHKALGNFVNFAMMNGLTIGDLPASLVKKGRKSGKNELSLPRKPNGPDSENTESSVKGRHAAIYKMAYSINGQYVPAGVTLNRLALFYCSTGTEWINGSELMELVEKVTGASWGAGDWEIQVPAGTLTAKKVQQ